MWRRLYQSNIKRYQWLPAHKRVVVVTQLRTLIGCFLRRRILLRFRSCIFAVRTLAPRFSFVSHLVCVSEERLVGAPSVWIASSTALVALAVRAQYSRFLQPESPLSGATPSSLAAQHAKPAGTARGAELRLSALRRTNSASRRQPSLSFLSAPPPRPGAARWRLPPAAVVDPAAA